MFLFCRIEDVVAELRTEYGKTNEHENSVINKYLEISTKKLQKLNISDITTKLLDHNQNQAIENVSHIDETFYEGVKQVKRSVLQVPSNGPPLKCR